MGILDAYKTDVENTSDNYDLPNDVNAGVEYDEAEYKARLDEMRRKMDEYDNHGTIDGTNVEIKDVTEDDPYRDCIKSEDEALEKFMEQYPYTSESSLNTIKHVCTPVVIRAYCPVCGEEIVNKVPAMFNPFSLQKVIKYDCKHCGWKANLEHTYPRVVFVNSDGEEIECYGK